MKRVTQLVSALLFLGSMMPAMPTAAHSEETSSLWNKEAGQRYTNRKAMHVGDLITVIVDESSSGTNSSSLRTKKESKFDASGGPGKGPLSFIPLFSAKTDAKDEMNGNGAVSLSGELSTRLTVQVIEIRPSGQLVVEGSRLVEVNGEEDRFTLHGVVRPEDIRADNTVQSNYLAEARISYAGDGAVHHAAKRGIFQRILSWIF
ncbi:MAG: flagellar basal body L-ring protein FlgH [Candidatus Eisenbacteria bacterium]